jgi:hypothetical protein
MSIYIFHGYRFDMAKPSGFIPVAISRCHCHYGNPLAPAAYEGLYKVN